MQERRLTAWMLGGSTASQKDPPLLQHKHSRIAGAMEEPTVWLEKLRGS